MRRVEYGDSDLIITFFTLKNGKISVIAKSAKKSKKRFAGILELFSLLQLVCNVGQRKGLPFLQEASLKSPFESIRKSLLKTAYAGYWVEIIDKWTESNKIQRPLYSLLLYALSQLDMDRIDPDVLSVIFQLRFLSICGIEPNLKRCMLCNGQLESICDDRVYFDLPRGGILCKKCLTSSSGRQVFYKGTIKILKWVQTAACDKLDRIRLTPQAVKEALDLLESFVPYHLGRVPKSLKFLRQIRNKAVRY